MQSLRSEHVAFDPRISHRTFNFSVVDAGLIKLLPPLVERLLNEAPNVRLNVLQLEAAHLEPWLESGKLDFAMGSFPSLTKGIRRQPLWAERYVAWCGAAIRASPADPTMRAFAAEKHVLVSIAGSGHAHQTMERALEAAIPPENIICRIPMFIGAAVLAKHTDAVAVLPSSIATVLAADLDLQIIRPPVKLPKIDIYQYWHDRLHRDPGNQWIRAVFASLFRKAAATSETRSPLPRYPRKYVGIHDDSPGNRITSSSTSVSASMKVQTCRLVSSIGVLAMLVVTNSSGAVGGETAPI